MTSPHRIQAIRTFLLLAMLTAFASPARAVSLFGLVDTGELFVSGDGGASWSIRSTLPVRDAMALFAGETASQLYLVSRSGSVHASADAGVSWSAISAVPASDVTAVVRDPDRQLLIMNSGGVYASLDAGFSFTAVGAIAAPDLVGGARLGSHVFAVGMKGAVHRSTDEGVTWNEVGTLPVSNAVAMVSHLGRLYVLTATGDLARSDDLGVDWSFVGTLSQSGMSSLLSGDGELIACTEAGEVAASMDGTSWSWRGTIAQLRVRALASDQPISTGVGPPGPRVRPEFAVWPNPSSGAASLVFDVNQPTDVIVGVFDLAGREVARPIVGERIPPGRTARSWECSALPGGLYWLHAVAGGHLLVRRLVVLQRR